MKKLIRNFFIGLGVLTFFSMLMGGFAIYKLTKTLHEPLPQEFTLIATIDTPMSDEKNFSFQTGSYGMTVQDYTNAFTKITKDPRVTDLHLRLKTPLSSITHVQELSNALQDIKNSGKQIHLYTEQLPNLPTIAFASNFNSTWLIPTGTASLSGVSLEVPFVKKALDSIGITPEFSRREAYKSAPETFMMESPSPEASSSLSALSNELYTQLITLIKSNRPDADLTPKAQVSDTELLERNIVDKIAYLDDFITFIEEKEKPQIALETYLSSYNYEIKDKITKAPTIAELTLNGMIIDPSMASASFNTSLGQETVINPYQVQEDIYDIIDTPEIKAVLIRLNSPGGSPTGAEIIRKSIQNIKKSGKKVYISMSEMAASGGYWMSVNADEIFASPATLTGSIGVYGGKFTLDNLWKKIGIHWQSFYAGSQNTLITPNTPLSENDKIALEEMMDDIYDKFLERVAAGRNISIKTLRTELAGGRVWTGEKAKEVGLVDHVGGIEDAVKLIKQDLNLSADDILSVVHYPKQKSPLEEVLSLLDGFFANALSIQSAITQTKNMAHIQQTSVFNPIGSIH